MVTASRLHKETDIARTTIYRHWPTQRDIIATLLAKATSEADVADFVGALRPDLEAAMEQLIFRFNNRPVRELFGALLEFGRSDAEFRDVAGAYVEGLLRSFRRAIDEAMERGDLTSTDSGHLVAELTGPLLLRHVLIGETVTRDDGQQMLDAFIARHAKPD